MGTVNLGFSSLRVERWSGVASEAQGPSQGFRTKGRAKDYGSCHDQ